MCGFTTIIVHSNEKGQVSIEELKKELTKDVAAIMLTIPNTLGIFEEQILEITKLCHDNGSLVYMDGANMNALLGIAKPADFGYGDKECWHRIEKENRCHCKRLFG